MANETTICISGNLVDDPSIRFLSSGHAVATLKVASTPRTYEKATNQWVDGETLFLTCTAWRQLAEHVADSLTKGCRVIVQGRLKSRSYTTKEGEKKTVLEVDVEDCGPSLRTATATVHRQGGGQQQRPQARQQRDPWADQPPAGGQPAYDRPPF